MPRHVRGAGLVGLRLGTVVGLLLFVACASVATAQTVTLLDDPEGDAVDAKAAAAACGGSPAAPACGTVPAAAPAPPDRDIAGAEATFGPEDAVFRLLLAEASDRLLGSAEDVSIHYMICFDGDTVVCFMADRTQAASATTGFLMVSGPECGPGGFCGWGVDLEVEAGAPGALAWRAPLEALPADWRPERATASVGETDMPLGDRWWSGPAGGQPIASFSGAVDYAEGTPDPFPPYERPRTPRAPSVAVDDAAEDAPAYVDLVAARWTETPETFVLELEYRDLVPTEGVEYGTMVALATSSRLVGIAKAEHGELEASTMLCQPEGDEPCARTVAVDVGFAVQGDVIRWTYPRAALGGPGAGTTVVIGWAWAIEIERATLGPLGTTETYGGGDAVLLPPFALESDTAAPPTQSRKAVTVDALHDVTALPLADLASIDALDVTFVEAEAIAVDESRVVLGVHDAASIQVPPGYDAVVYAVAFETDAGAFMVGLYHADVAQEFFCAQDTLVFAGTRVDPLQVARQAIAGAVSTASDRTAPGAEAGEGAGGSVTFYVPHACFAQATGGAVHAERAAAGTYLIRNPSGRAATIEVADDVAYADPVVLEAASVAAAPAPWYANPFGIDNFYDITGILIAVAVSGVGVVAVQRKRNLLRTYLREIDQAGALPTPKATETALQALFARAKEDFARGRLSEGHFVVVERRIEAGLSATRAALLRAAFGDLPARLLEQLQAFLADGDMSADEYRAFCSQLDGERLSVDVKDEIRTRVRAWVAEHGRTQA